MDNSCVLRTCRPTHSAGVIQTVEALLAPLQFEAFLLPPFLGPAFSTNARLIGQKMFAKKKPSNDCPIPARKRPPFCGCLIPPKLVPCDVSFFRVPMRRLSRPRQVPVAALSNVFEVLVDVVERLLRPCQRLC